MQLMFSANASGTTTSLHTAAMAPEAPVPAGSIERDYAFIASSYAAFMRSSSSGRGLQVMWPVVLLMTSMR